MQLFKKVPFNFEEKAYEIRIYYNDTRINVVAFLNRHPATGFRHQVVLPKQCDIQRLLKEALLDDLIAMSKNDIIDGRIQKLAAMLGKHMTYA